MFDVNSSAGLQDWVLHFDRADPEGQEGASVGRGEMGGELVELHSEDQISLLIGCARTIGFLSDSLLHILARGLV